MIFFEKLFTPNESLHFDERQLVKDHFKMQQVISRHLSLVIVTFIGLARKNR